jgi:hypothetical protein
VEETTSKSESSKDDNEEGEEEEEEGDNSFSPTSTPKDLPSLGDLFSRQAGISVGAPRPKRPQTGLLALIKRRFYAPTY